MPRPVDYAKRLVEARDKSRKADHAAEVARVKFRAEIVAAVDSGSMGQGGIARLLGVSEKRVYDHLSRARSK